jgi:hypothetical protein
VNLHPIPVELTAGMPAAGELAPGELLAIAYAMFMASALAESLATAGTQARELVVVASCTFREDLPERPLTALDFDVEGRVHRLDEDAFRRIAIAARSAAVRAAGGRDLLPGTLRAELQPAS